MADHYVTYQGGDQDIRSIPMDNGRPVVTSATYAILDLRYGEDEADRVIVASGTAATADGYSGTTQAVAGVGSADRSRIDVDDVTGLEVGDLVLLSGGGSQQLVEIRALDAGNDRIYITGEVDGQYAVGSTVSGIQVAATFPSSEAADENRLDAGGGPYAVDWKYAGVDGVYRQIVYVRRHARGNSITARDVEILDPMAVRATGNRFPIDDAISQAQRDFDTDLMSRGIKPSRFHGGEIEKNCVTYRAAMILRLAMGRDEDDAMVQMYRGRWLGMLNNLTIGKPGADVVHTDNDDDVTGAQDNTQRGVFGLS